MWRQEPVYEGLKEEYAKQGILFCSMDTAITEYPELVQKYFMTKCVPAQDNKFSALHGAVWSGGAFCYIPKGVKCDLPLQSYFRMEGAGEGTFEHTLIIADEGSEVNYIEGCTAQTYSVNSMHSAVVEIFVHEGAKARYTTVQNWSKDVYNLNTKRAVVDAEGTVEWVGGSMGAKYVMLYPGSFLMGEGARADHLNVGVAGKGVHKDTGAKVVHLAPNTTSNILAKSISKDGGIMGYRGLVKMGHNSAGSKARVQCDGLMMDGESKSDTWPDIQIQNPHVTVAHEATVGRISDDQLFYMGSRGFTEDEAAAMIVNGFIEPVTKELPMEYAVELNRLIQLEMVGSIGSIGYSARSVSESAAVDNIVAPLFPTKLPWVNASGPQSIIQQGRPMLVEFWDFCRPNSMRTLPYMKAWHERYAAAGLRVIGVHCPGFRGLARRAGGQGRGRALGIAYPVLIDTELEVWQDYENEGWPARYLFDGRARLFDYHYGEGAYEETRAGDPGAARASSASRWRRVAPGGCPRTRCSPRRRRTSTGAYSGPVRGGRRVGGPRRRGTVTVNGGEAPAAGS